MSRYQVYAHAVGTLYAGPSRAAAVRVFRRYARLCLLSGRGSGLAVTLLADGKPARDFFPF